MEGHKKIGKASDEEMDDAERTKSNTSTEDMEEQEKIAEVDMDDEENQRNARSTKDMEKIIKKREVVFSQ